MDKRLTRYETPVSDKLIQPVWEMWRKVPEMGVASDVTGLADQLANRTRPEDRGLLYVARVNGNVAGTSMLLISRRDPRLAEFTLPGTALEFRRRGIGQALFDAPVADFREMGGEAIFLGTNQLAAARAYYRSGYRKLVGSIALVYVFSGESPEAYFVDHFRGLGPATVHPGEPSDRTPAVPLVLSPHDWQVMDANVGSMSLRYSTHWAFAPQVGRYIALLDDERSTFFAARAGDRQKVVGLSTARLGQSGECSVDAFTHRYYFDTWSELIEAAVDWGAKRGARSHCATVSVEDCDKIALFEGLGFREAGPAGEYTLNGVNRRENPNGRPVAAVRMRRG